MQRGRERNKRKIRGRDSWEKETEELGAKSAGEYMTATEARDMKAKILGRD
jgi:hypothetical protein